MPRQPNDPTCTGECPQHLAEVKFIYLKCVYHVNNFIQFVMCKLGQVSQALSDVRQKSEERQG